MNTVNLTGRLTNEPDFHTLQSGSGCARFTVAVNRNRRDAGADFIPCVAFGKTAEFIKKYFEKGQKIDLVGAITSGSYEKDGQKIFTLNVTVNSVEFGESRASKAQNTTDTKKSESAADVGPTETSNDFMDIPMGADEEVPF